MTLNRTRKRAAASARLLVCSVLLAASLGASIQAKETIMTATQLAADPELVGMWVTHDGHIRLEMLPDGRYDEARGERRGAYRGRWVRKGGVVEFFDDSGFTATGAIENGVLTAGPDRFRKE